MAVRGKLRFGRSFVATLEEKVGNVAVYGEAKCALGVEFGVIPLEVYSRKKILSMLLNPSSEWAARVMSLA